MLAKQHVLLRRGVVDESDFQNEVLELEGLILNEESHEPIGDILIYDDLNRFEAISNHDGVFKLYIPAHLMNTNFVHFRGLGYHHRSIALRDLFENSTVQIESDPFFDRDGNCIRCDPRLLTVRNNELHHILRSDRMHGGAALSLSGSDLVRVAQLLPGVQAHDDRSAQIKIRGSEGEETLMLLDGIPIYRADHFYGIFSSINSSYINEARLYKNGIPVEYGGKNRWAI